MELLHASDTKWHQRTHASPVLGQVTTFDLLEPDAEDDDDAGTALVPPGPNNAIDVGVR